MSKWLIVSDNHTESGILYQLYDYHKDADICLHLEILNLNIMILN